MYRIDGERNPVGYWQAARVLLSLARLVVAVIRLWLDWPPDADDPGPTAF